jgi:hypothetical protein
VDKEGFDSHSAYLPANWDRRILYTSPLPTIAAQASVSESPAAEGAVGVPVVVATAPERIWLQVAGSDDGYGAGEMFPSDHDGITWCQDSIGGVQVEYVRADIHPQPASAEPAYDRALIAKMLQMPFAYTAAAAVEQVTLLQAADNASEAHTAMRPSAEPASVSEEAPVEWQTRHKWPETNQWSSWLTHADVVSANRHYLGHSSFGVEVQMRELHAKLVVPKSEEKSTCLHGYPHCGCGETLGEFVGAPERITAQKGGVHHG